MSTYDFNAKSGDKVLLSVGMNVTQHEVYFRFSDSATMRSPIDIKIEPVVMESMNVKVKLPLFTHDIYYELFSVRGLRTYQHLKGTITYVPGGPSTEYVRTINNKTPDNNGNINLVGGGTGPALTIYVDPDNDGILILEY